LPKDLLCGWFASFWAATFFTFLAIKFTAEMFGAPFWCDDPRPVFPRRPVPYMLPVSALQIGYPIAVLIQMKTDNFP